MKFLPVQTTLPALTQEELNEGAIFDYEPGNATRYRVFIQQKQTSGLVHVGLHGQSAGNGFYHFAMPPHPSYVMEKLNLKYDGDGQAIANLIRHYLS